MNLQQLTYFRAVAELEHMSKAAQKLHVSQPALSYAMTELEKELGVPLFERQGRNIKLSRYGRQFLQRIAKGLNEIDGGVQEIRSLASPSEGTIGFAYYNSLGSKLVPDLIQKFYQLDDTKAVKFTLHQAPTAAIVKGLKNGDFELALASSQADPDIECVPIFKQELIIILPKNHPLAKNKTLQLADLKDEPFIAYRENTGLRPIIDDILKNAKVQPHTICEVVDNETVIGLVSSGLGVSIVPRIFGLEAYAVAAFPIKKSLYKRYIYLLWRNQAYMSPAAARFRQLVLSQLTL